MSPKETATATVETFLKLLGCKVQVIDKWETHGFMSAFVRDYQGRYTISAESFEDLPDTITVRIYDFKDDAKRETVLVVSNITLELTAKFTREAINAYEEKLGE